jgi:hypothetical protein
MMGGRRIKPRKHFRGEKSSQIHEEWLGQKKGEKEAGFVGCQLLVPGGVTS